MVLTRERALELHRKMWSDMRDILGDDPIPWKRINFKDAWINEHFPNAEICNNCFLCEYVENEDLGCSSCPIKWPYGYCGNYYLDVPISKLLALPERGGEADEEIEEEPAEMKDGLYLCDLQYSAEGDCTGYMYLTKQEYETVKKVVNTCNWQNVCDEGYAGSLSIYCDKLEEK